MPYHWLGAAFATLSRHGIEPWEVLQVLAGKNRFPVPVTYGGLRLLEIRGRTRAGRTLAVAVRRAGQFDWTIVGARALTAEERQELQLWEQNR